MNGHMDANIARFATHSPAILLAGMGVAAVVILLGAIMIGVNWSPHLGRASTKHPRSWDSFAEAETKRRKSRAAGQAVMVTGVVALFALGFIWVLLSVLT